VAVFGVPHPEFGEEVKAAVQLVEGASPTPELADELIAFSRDKLAKFKCPRSVDFLVALPRTPAGKLRKSELRDQYRPNAGTTA
jgi:acyl-coenzyme A synthetase/AMP-(fatty) acid ligase